MEEACCDGDVDRLRWLQDLGAFNYLSVFLHRPNFLFFFQIF